MCQRLKHVAMPPSQAHRASKFRLCLRLDGLFSFPLFNEGQIGRGQTLLVWPWRVNQELHESLSFLFLQHPGNQSGKDGRLHGRPMAAPQSHQQQKRLQLFDLQFALPAVAIQPEPFLGKSLLRLQGTQEQHPTGECQGCWSHHVLFALGASTDPRLLRCFIWQTQSQDADVDPLGVLDSRSLLLTDLPHFPALSSTLYIF